MSPPWIGSSSGIYQLAVSGASNEIFSAGWHSGLPELHRRVRPEPQRHGCGTGSVGRALDPEQHSRPGALLTSAPLAIRVELSRPLDPASVRRGPSVFLSFSPDGMFRGEGVQSVPLAALRYSDSAGGVQMIPASPLAPGFYQVVLAGRGERGRRFDRPGWHPVGVRRPTIDWSGLSLHVSGGRYRRERESQRPRR